MSNHHTPGYGPGYGPGPGPHYGYGYESQLPGPSRTSAMWCHLGALLTITAGNGLCCLGMLGGWIAPLCIRGGRNQHDPYVRHHATQALNFGITQAIMAVLGILLYFGSALTFAAVATSAQLKGAGMAVPVLTVIVMFSAYFVTSFVFAVIGTVKANRGEMWSYPRLIAWPLSKG